MSTEQLKYKVTTYNIAGGSMTCQLTADKITDALDHELDWCHKHHKKIEAIEVKQIK